MKTFLSFFAPAAPRPAVLQGAALDRRYNFLRIRQVLAMLVTYALFYVCRLSFSVTKKTMIDSGAYTAKELGFVGSALLIAYAIGKILNGFLADHANVRRFIGFGLFASAMANFAVGFHLYAGVLAAVWFGNGLVQATGAPCCVVALSRWFSKRERGTYYGIWSCSNNLGEALCYIITAVVMVWARECFGENSPYVWKSAFWCASAMGLAGIGLVAMFFRDSPQSEGLPPVNVWKNEAADAKEKASAGDVGKGQRIALTDWAVWMIALSGGLFAASRYAIIDWGPFFLQVKKGYGEIDAAWIVSINSAVGAVSSGLSGIVSDRMFKGSRNELALIAGVLNVTGLCLLMLVPGQHMWVDVLALSFFGLASGILLTFLGGLMAVDLVPRVAAGAALGIAGMGNYIGAGIQSIVSGFLIKDLPETVKELGDGAKLLKDGSTLFKDGRLVDAAGNTVNRFYSTSFEICGSEVTVDWIAIFWIGVAMLSLLCALSVWKRRPETADGAR